LLYLRLLKVPGIEALEIGIDALLRGRRAVENGETYPAVAAMRALRTVLEERKMAPALPTDQGNRFGKICPWLAKRAGVPPGAKSMPLLNRGAMLPDRL
jgi:hypothetical protein